MLLQDMVRHSRRPIELFLYRDAIDDRHIKRITYDVDLIRKSHHRIVVEPWLHARNMGECLIKVSFF